MEDPTSVSDDKEVLMEDVEGIELESDKAANFVSKASHEAKLKELLHKINSIEIKLCSDATKEFIKLLKGDSGGELLHLYVHSTCNFSELFAALKLREGKVGTHYILKLISVILGHPDGKYMPNDKHRIGVSTVLDKFARSFIEEKLDFVYKELSSKDKKRQNAVLLVISSIVRRGSGLASEVAKKFDFKLKEFLKLAEYKPRKNDNKSKFSRNDEKRKYITRKAFIGFAMSFLEVGKPGLLRWVLQQREVYSSVLRGLTEDDDEIVMYVLSILRDRVLTEESMIPPALRSVLFGSVVLKQLVDISGEYGRTTAELAHNVLHMVCTNPCNGLMPDLKRHPNPLRGNPKRLLQLMKKLKATEGGYHMELLLDIVKGSPSLGSAYIQEFPYNLEDYASPGWFCTVYLAANLVSLVVGVHLDLLDSQSDDPPSFDNVGLQNIMKIISSRPLSRSVINKGLLHSEFLVKNGTLRLLLETLRLIDSFFRAIKLSCERKQMMPKWAAFKQEIQNELQTLLPDPQVFLTLLSPLTSHIRTNKSCFKRKADGENFLVGCKRTKKLKINSRNEDADIVIGGISSSLDNTLPMDGEALDSEMELLNVMSELWDFDRCCVSVTTLEEAELFFHSKLLDALKIYHQIMPTDLEGSFDFFMNLLMNPSELPSHLLLSLLSLLVEFIRWSPGNGTAIRTPQMMYKHLQPFLNLLLFSPIVDIKDKAYNLARAAMSSTGAFDKNLHEIVAWFLFLPGYNMVKSSVEIHGEVLQSLSTVVISFLCDAISTVGNNLFRYWNAVRNHTCHLNEFTVISPEFSPLIICVLQKCIRLLSSESGTFSLPEKSMISAYVCNTLKYLLQTQVDARLLAALIRSVLSEGFQDRSVDSFCEWWPLKNLLLLAESILLQKVCCFFLIDHKDLPVDIPFRRALGEVRAIVQSENDAGERSGIMKAFYSAIICTTPTVVLKEFPTVMAISQHIQIPLSFLFSIIFMDQNFLAGVLKLWPKIFFPGLEKAFSVYNSQVTENDVVAQEIMLNVDFDATEATAAVAFGLFLRQAPFHMLFPIITSSNCPCLLGSSMIKDLLMAKLSECTSDFVVSYLQLLLFWFHQIQLSYSVKPLANLKEFAEICYILVKHMLDQLFLLKPYSEDFLSAELKQEVVKIIFCHPAVKSSLTDPLGCDHNSLNEDFTEGTFRGSLEEFFVFSQMRVHPLDNHVLNLLTTTFDYFLSPSRGQHFVLKVDGSGKQIVNVFNTLMQRLYLELKDKLDLCIRTEDLLPLLQPFYALHALMQFMSPFKLFELVRWIFDRVEVNGLTVQQSCTTSVISVGFCIAADAFKVLSIYLQQPGEIKALFCTFWKMEEKDLDINLIEEIYVEVCKFATNFGLDFAYSCLLEAVGAVYKQKYLKSNLLDPLSLAISRLIVSTPVEIVSHCIYGTSKTKAKLLFLLVEMSPLHLSVFGYLFTGILNKNIHVKVKMVEETSDMSLSDENFMLLLPSALSVLNSVFKLLGKQYHKQYIDIPSFYSEILLIGFQNWKSFVSGCVFEETYDALLPSSIERFGNLVDASLLGKAMHMLRYHFALNGEMKIKERLKMISCILTSSDAHDHLLDCDIDEIEFYSNSQVLNLINGIAGKIIFCRMLLFSIGDQMQYLPREADDLKAMEMVSSKVSRPRMRFIQILVRTWQCMVKKFPSISDCSRKEQDFGCLQQYRYLELFILNTVLELTSEIRDDLIQLQDIPFLEQLMKSSLLYRFEDPTTLNILRSILTSLSGGKFSSILYLQLLLAHSQFASTIRSVTEMHSSQTGAFFKPISSILRSLVNPHSIGKNDLRSTNPYLKQLAIVKLLKTLVHFISDQLGCYSGREMGINLKELYLLLLSSYGATLSDIDLEIFGLMRMIESIDNSVSKDLADMDYMWGNAALKIRKERALDGDASSSIMPNTEVLEERRRSQFREILPINPKMCAITVIHFPYDRILSIEPEDPKTTQVRVAHFPGVEQLERCDPIFILNFTNHNLSTGYIEPLECASLGLLAVAFISMSSPDTGIRKLGDACLGKFKDALERGQKKKDLLWLHLLLIYMQNGIKEQFQRIPSVIALFAAESSVILMDPSNDLFTTLSNHLMHSSVVDMKCIPLFHTLFQSNSVNFRAERLWMLRLACAGLNLDDDAQIFISSNILQTLLSFYATPLADDESKELILQVLKKAIKIVRMTRHLIECCGLFPWLSSIISVPSANNFSSPQLMLATEVVFDIISARDIIESPWFGKYAFEQVMELASHLHKILVGGSKLIKENVVLIDPILQIIILILKISQKKEICQPHFTPSFEGLCGIYHAFNAFGTSRSGPNAKTGLEAILNSTPPVDFFNMKQEKVSGFLMCVVSTAMKYDCENLSQIKESQVRMIHSEETPPEESLISKLLRWLVAAVILGKLSQKLNDVNTKFQERSSPHTLHSFLEYIEKGCGGSKIFEFGCEEIFAATIFYLQQIIGLNQTVPSSVVSALYILLLCGPSNYLDIMHGYGVDIVSIRLKVRCPTEANPEWRWSFDKPWRDSNLEMSNLQLIDEYHACQTLMVIISNILGKKPLDSFFLSLQNLANPEIFAWERRIIGTNDN